MANPVKSNIVSFGAYEFNPYSRELRKEGMRVCLEGQPLAILEVLLERPGELVTREELQKRLWPEDTFVDFEHSLNAAANFDVEPRQIQNIWQASDVVDC